jgi:hypothetical protein
MTTEAPPSTVMSKDDSTTTNKSTRSTVSPLTNANHNIGRSRRSLSPTKVEATSAAATPYQSFRDEDDAFFEDAMGPTSSETKISAFHPRRFFQLQNRNRSSIKDPRRWNSIRRQSSRSSIRLTGLGGVVGGNGGSTDHPSHESLALPGNKGERDSLHANGGFHDSTFAHIFTDGEGHCTDQSGAVDSFFSSIRVPSSFIVGVSFSELFGNYKGDGQDDGSTVQQFLQTMCVLCQGFTFCLSLSVIVLSTSALIRGLTANFDPFAENGYELLFREFHFEFVCVRWAYNMSMFGFLLAVGAKILHEFELFNYESEDFERGHMEMGIAVVLILLAMAMHLFAVRLKELQLPFSVA